MEDEEAQPCEVVLAVLRPATGPAEYAAFLAGHGAGGAEPEDHARWADRVLGEFEERLARELVAMAEELRLSVLDLSAPAPMDHDRRFAAVAWGATVETGWRRDEDGYLVGVFPTGPWREALSGGDVNELAATGRCPTAFVQAHADCVEAVSRHVLNHLARAGIATGEPVPGDAFDETLAEAEACLDVLDLTPDENLSRIGEGERIDLLAYLTEFELNGEAPPFEILVAAYVPASDAIVGFQPGDEGGPVRTYPVPDGWRGFLAGLEPQEGLVALPIRQETLDWARSVSGGRGRAFMAMPDEYGMAVDDECLVGWDGEDGRVEVGLTADPDLRAST